MQRLKKRIVGLLFWTSDEVESSIVLDWDVGARLHDDRSRMIL